MWRNSRVMMCVIAATLVAAGAHAQSAMLNLPRVSQHERITQRIGLTDVTLDFSRPAVRARRIFGGLQPYGQVWRAGANENTTIAFTDPVTINGQPLAAGAYGLHMIPGADSWIVIFSKNSTSWGSFTYDQAEDALRVTVKPETIPQQEILNYSIDEPTVNSAVIAMRWDTVAVSWKVGVDTNAIVKASLDKQLRGRVQFEWQPWQEAAEFLLQNDLDANEALKWSDNSIANEDRFENEYTKAKALTALGRTEDAKAARDKAIALGTQIEIHTLARVLMNQGRMDEGMQLLRANIKKYPTGWMAHNEAARIAVVQGDFDTAVREMKLAAEQATGPLKQANADLVKQLENKVDINK
jgi:hypothetical protein